MTLGLTSADPALYYAGGMGGWFMSSRGNAVNILPYGYPTGYSSAVMSNPGGIPYLESIYVGLDVDMSQAMIDAIDDVLNPVYYPPVAPASYNFYYASSGRLIDMSEYAGSSVTQPQIDAKDAATFPAIQIARQQAIAVGAIPLTDRQQNMLILYGSAPVMAEAPPGNVMWNWPPIMVFGDMRFAPPPKNTGRSGLESIGTTTGVLDLTREMHGGAAIIAIALTAGAASAAMGAGEGAAAATGAEVGAAEGVGAGTVTATEVGGASTTAAFVGDIPVAGETGVSIYEGASVATVATETPVIADATVPLDAMPAGESVASEDALQVAVDQATAASDVPAYEAPTESAFTETGERGIAQQMQDLYKEYKPWVDKVQSAYKGYQALTQQQKASNTPNIVRSPTVASRYAPLQLAPVGISEDSMVMPAALLLLAIVAKSAKRNKS